MQATKNYEAWVWKPDCGGEEMKNRETHRYIYTKAGVRWVRYILMEWCHLQQRLETSACLFCTAQGQGIASWGQWPLWGNSLRLQSHRRGKL